jgi:predicted translin family RNA/ssDNA-binding protein
MDDLDGMVNENVRILSSLLPSDPEDNERRLSSACEKFVEIRLLRYFFSHGCLAVKSVVQPCTDDEYLLGSLGFAHELVRYAIGQASEGNTQSIELCKKILVNLNAKMIEFDFRNGPLRRKYDGLKYALKKIEEIIYELSLLDDLDEDPALKRMKVDPSQQASEEAPLIDENDIDAIRERYVEIDKTREEVIKQSRDVQKWAKQAIFSVHRGKVDFAKKTCDDCIKVIQAIMPSIDKHPELRYGSFSNSLEEYAEAMLTITWVESKRIMTRAELELCSRDEYIGALADFTGEIGRIAVSKASSRDTDGVKEILQADLVLYNTLMKLNIGGKYQKKVDETSNNLKKVEDILYDLSLLSHGGRGGKREGRVEEVKGNNDAKTED